MREYKFRAWNARVKIMTYDYEWTLGLQSSKTIYDFFNIENDEVKFMQFTGLHDRNGKEIYEGDLCKIPHDYFKLPHVVRFNDGKWELFLEKEGTEVLYDWIRFGVKVIGNIWENSDLIEEASE